MGHQKDELTLDGRDLRNGPSFCKAAFDSLHIAIGGSAMPCCQFKGSVGDTKTNSVEEVFNSNASADLRAKMLRGETAKQCVICYEAERAGAISLRQRSNGPDPIPAAPHVELKHLDIRFSNLCNLGCRSCGPDASTKWYSDAKKITQFKVGPEALIKTFASAPSALESLRPHLGTVESIYFAGGEPLLQEEHYAILRALIDAGRTDVLITYSSNLTELKLGKSEIIPLWSRFDRVHLGASIDGHEERGELIRHGLSWAKFARNIQAVREGCPHVSISFDITVSVFNIITLPELCRSLMNIDLPGAARFYFNILQTPVHYSSQILPLDMKLIAKDKIEAFAKEAGLVRDLAPVVNFMMHEDRSDALAGFRRNSLRLDDIRGQNTAQTIPELSPLLQETPWQAKVRKIVQSVDGVVANIRNGMA